MQWLGQHTDVINSLNVFPVPDGDTGTNMAFTFKTILEATATSPDNRVDDLMNHVAEAALDGARGNSGAIMAQYFHGFREAVTGHRLLTPQGFADAAVAGAAAAWTAMSKPVQGTLPTVLEDFSREVSRRVSAGSRDIQTILFHGLERARESLANTPNQLPALKQAGVVDAGGQGFVDLLDGILSSGSAIGHIETSADFGSGDKGNRANIGVIARRPEYLPYIWHALSPEVVAARFRHFLEGDVERFLLPGIGAINFVLHDVLGGGGVASLRNDPQGKAYAQILLAARVKVPQSLVDAMS